MPSESGEESGLSPVYDKNRQDKKRTAKISIFKSDNSIMEWIVQCCECGERSASS